MKKLYILSLLMIIFIAGHTYAPDENLPSSDEVEKITDEILREAAEAAKIDDFQRSPIDDLQPNGEETIISEEIAKEIWMGALGQLTQQWKKHPLAKRDNRILEWHRHYIILEVQKLGSFNSFMSDDKEVREIIRLQMDILREIRQETDKR